MTHNFKEIKYPLQPSEKKISFNLEQINTPAPAPKAIPKPIIKKPLKKEPVIQKPISKKAIEKKSVIKKVEPEPKRTLQDTSPKPLAKKSTKENNITKPKKKKKVTKKIIKPKPKPKKKKVNKKVTTVATPKRKPSSLADSLMGFGSFQYTAKPTHKSVAKNKNDKKIKNLYGGEFDSYTNTQKKYIRHNLNNIQRITQNTLSRNGYPETAVRTKQAGTNIVSFYLHPNGDISGLKLKRSLGYASLDKNTLKVIRIAYKDYPLPNQKTRLIFRVEYSLY